MGTTAQPTFDPTAASGAPTYSYETQGEGGAYRTSAKGKAGGSSITTAHFRQSQQSAQTRVTMHERVARAPQPVAQPQAPAAVEEDSYEATARRMREAMVRYQSDYEDTLASRYEDPSHSRLAEHGQVWYPGTRAMPSPQYERYMYIGA